MLKKIDLHMHSTVSDGTDTPAELLDHVRRAGLELFSVTDHDAVLASEQIPALLHKGDPLFLRGIEFSCRDEFGKYHILGYGYDPGAEAIHKMVDTGHSLRMMKMRSRLSFLKEKFGFTFPEQEVEDLLARDNPGKPHLGNLMVKYGYASSKEQAINEYINQKRFGNSYIRPEDAVGAILESGGIPVTAHPVYGSGEELIIGPELETRVKRLMEFGVQGLEAYYSGYSQKLQKEVLSLAEKYGLYVTAGSDYHGKNKLVTMGDTGLPDASEGPEGLRRFLRFVRERLV